MTDLLHHTHSINWWIFFPGIVPCSLFSKNNFSTRFLHCALCDVCIYPINSASSILVISAFLPRVLLDDQSGVFDVSFPGSVSSPVLSSQLSNYTATVPSGLWLALSYLFPIVFISRFPVSVILASVRCAFLSRFNEARELTYKHTCFSFCATNWSTLSHWFN